MKKCPNCYAHLPNDLESCPMCGTSVKDAEILPDDPKPVSAPADDNTDSIPSTDQSNAASSAESAKRFCPFCGKELQTVGATFCPFCGKELNASASAPSAPVNPPTYTAPQTSPKKNRKICPNCGMIYYGERTECPDCHVKLLAKEETVIQPKNKSNSNQRKLLCPQCQAVYTGNQTVCPHCHVPLVDYYTKAPSSSSGYQNDANGCLIVAAFLLPVIGFIIAAVNYSNGNQNAGGSYLKAAIAGIIVNVVLIILLAACGAFSGPTYYYY